MASDGGVPCLPGVTVGGATGSGLGVSAPIKGCKQTSNMPVKVISFVLAEVLIVIMRRDSIGLCNTGDRWFG